MKSKKKKSDSECKAQFARTVSKTGKWRGMKPDAYAKKYSNGFRSGTAVKECEHLFDLNDICLKCGISKKFYAKLHPKLLKRKAIKL